MKKEKQGVDIVRSSAAEYLTFITATGKSDVNAVYFDENVWLTQKMMGLLYNVETHTINYHLKKIFADGEIDEDSVIRKFRITAADGKNYNTNHYNLSAIIAVGNKVDSPRAVQFRKWANHIIEEFTVKGFAMDDERLKNGGTVLTKDYFKEQLERIREIRLSERRFYQKITDIYATSIDYDAKSQTAMARIVNAYLDLAELRAEEEVPMTMEDWAEQFEGVLRLSRKEILTNAGSISAKIAEQYALSEFEKYRVRQDRLYQSDFDRVLLGETEDMEITDDESLTDARNSESKEGGEDA